MTVSSPCPRCPSGVVAVTLQEWTAGGRVRRSAWADEPLRCSRGCALTPRQVERVLVAVYEAPARQLPLFQEAAG